MPPAFYTNHCKYHTSWDWLMPAIEKMGELDAFRRNFDLSLDYFISGDIHSVWLSVVEFTKWHNKNK